MKKKTGKVNQIATGFAAVLLGLIVAGTGTKVFANNNSDTYEYFSFSGDNTVHSDFRRKDDTTSSWCKCFNASSDESEFYVTVYGTSEHNNTPACPIFTVQAGVACYFTLFTLYTISDATIWAKPAGSSRGRPAMRRAWS